MAGQQEERALEILEEIGKDILLRIHLDPCSQSFINQVCDLQGGVFQVLKDAGRMPKVYNAVGEAAKELQDLLGYKEESVQERLDGIIARFAD